jgi:hypothetical protein
MLSRRYFSRPLPLDIADEDLMAGGDAIKRAVQALDENGFASDGDVLGPALVRARAQLAYIKEELLEMALANSVKSAFGSLT